MSQAPNFHFIRKLMVSLAALGTLGLLACTGMTGGGGLGVPAANNADNSNSNLGNQGSIEEGTVGDEGLDPSWLNQDPSQEGQLDSPDDTPADARVAAADPMNGGFADPDKAVYHGIKVYFRKMTILCVDPVDHAIKVKMEGHVKTKDGEERVFRVVEKPTMKYLDTQTHQDEGGYVSFEIVTRPSLPLKFFLLPKDYPVGAMDTLIPCENGSCIKEGKVPITVYPFFMDSHYDPKHVTGPLCPRFEKLSGSSSQSSDSKSNPQP